MNEWNPSILFLQPVNTMANMYNAFSPRQKWSLCPQSMKPGPTASHRAVILLNTHWLHLQVLSVSPMQWHSTAWNHQGQKLTNGSGKIQNVEIPRAHNSMYNTKSHIEKHISPSSYLTSPGTLRQSRLGTATGLPGHAMPCAATATATTTTTYTPSWLQVSYLR